MCVHAVNRLKWVVNGWIMLHGLNTSVRGGEGLQQVLAATQRELRAGCAYRSNGEVRTLRAQQTSQTIEYGALNGENAWGVCL